MATKKYSTGNGMIKVGVILADFIIINLLLFWASRYVHYIHPIYPLYFKEEPRVTFMIANISMIIAQFSVGITIHRRRSTVDEVFMNVFKLCLLHSAIMFFCLRMIGESGGMFRFMVIFFTVELMLIFVSRLIEKLMIRLFRQAGRNTRSVVFVGNDPAILMLYRDLISDPSTGYQVWGYFADNPIENCPPAIRFLGSLNDLNHLIDKPSGEQLSPTDIPSSKLDLSKLDELFCCLSHDENERIMRMMKFCDQNIVHFYYIPRMSGNFLLNLQPEQLGDTMVFTNHHEPLSHPINQFIKRTFDVVVSSIVCIVILPFIPIIAFMIKRQSPGPLFFKQERTGLNGKTFTCLKFRSMHVNADADRLQATKDDPRKFPFGEFIRHTNIDEFPQFFNVLKGDMSIVGPRPHMLAHTKQYGSIIDKYMVRHFSLPGITGYAQVTGCRGETKELWEMEERVQKDIWYIENWSFWLDLKIIFKTALTLIRPDKKAY
jgi:putative colanic acid biosynthesis UDP-glucose lipid carrier transferase